MFAILMLLLLVGGYYYLYASPYDAQIAYVECHYNVTGKYTEVYLFDTGRKDFQVAGPTEHRMNFEFQFHSFNFTNSTFETHLRERQHYLWQLSPYSLPDEWTSRIPPSCDIRYALVSLSEEANATETDFYGTPLRVISPDSFVFLL
jgi:hypothetical protein